MMFRALLVLLLLVAAPLGACAELLASPEVRFREARVRLLAQRESNGQLSGAVQITLTEGYKTYWKNPGDSGVPPQFDFSASSGISSIEIRYPFPQAFDDGAGGQAFGYKHSVLLPFEGKAEAAGILNLRLDFAVCGKLCIPLSAQLSLELARAAGADADDARALTATRAQLPKTLGGEGMSVARMGSDSFLVTLPYAGAVEGLQAFPQAPGFFEVKGIEAAGPGMVRLRLAGQSAPGSKTLGPLWLTYGTVQESFERVLDVDGAH